MSDHPRQPPTSPGDPGDGPKADRADAQTHGGGDERDELLRLASVVAHQLKSPLSSVQNVLTTVLGGFAGPLEARQRWLLEKALERCSKGTYLVRDLLRLRAVDRLDDEMLGPVNLVAAFAAALDQVKDAARDAEIQLQSSVEVADADAAWIHGDATLVREILGVLLDNAVKYTPKEGRITARLWLETGGEQEQLPQLRVEVVDSGIGIPPEGYERLFEEFYRAPNAKRLATDGSGLGLAFAWRAARRLEGTVELRPAPTGGVSAVAGFPQRPDYAGGVGAVAIEGSEDAGGDRAISQHVVIVGGVTAGSKAAARIMRLDPDADVTVVERGQFLAYSGCGLPFYISGAVSEQRALLETPLGLVRDPAFFHKLKNVRALDLTDAVRIDRERKTLVVRNLLDQHERELPYDRLILATGARPIMPELEGAELEGIHTLHGVEDAEAIRSLLGQQRVKDVVILGGGLLGCQITESVALRGARITLVEARPSILNVLDEEIAALVRRYLESRGVRIHTDTSAVSFEGETRVRAVQLADGSHIPCDIVIVALGRRPDVRLASDAGLELGSTGAIRVDSLLRTSDPEIFAAGDCVEQKHVVTGKPAWIPGAVPAILQGRVAANNVCGKEEAFPAVTGTFIVKLFDWTAGRTGLTEREAREAGFDPVSVIVPGPDRVHYIPTARNLVLKLIADRATGRLLGAQGVGPGEIAKRIDVVATALASGADLEGLTHLTLAYAPPFSMAMDLVVTAANVMRNKLEGLFSGISPIELRQRMLAEDAPLLLDVRQSIEYGQERIRGSRHIPLGNLRSRLHDLPRDRTIVVVCSFGLRSYEASRVLTTHGFEDVWVLDGGLEAWPYSIERLV
jgi:NADPH-dependent 2,4-dienoyl-CoA reductase/sulfur reductase-like enzyme/rhodanese-related sulfurtransferase